MEIDSKADPLQVLQRFSFSTDLPSGKCLKWSESNRLVGLNICDKLLIFQFNIHFSLNESTVNRKQWCKNNLKLSVVTIKPEHEFEYNVGHLDNIQRSYRQGYLKPNSKIPRSEFKYFDFSPSSPFRSYSVLGTITVDFVFILYLQCNSQPWHLICNLSQCLNSYYIDNKWNNFEQEKINFSEHCLRLDSLSTTCFCWHPRSLHNSQCAEYSICSASKSGDICFWSIRLSKGEEGTPKCEAKIEQIFSSGLQEIVTLQIIRDHWLLVEAACGRAVLFDIEDGTLNRTISLWSEADNLPCYNFNFTQLQNGSTEIVFHKIQTVIRIHISAKFKLEFVQTYPLEENIELLSIYNYGEKYCATQYNTSSVWLIDFERNPSDRKLLLQSQIKFSDFTFNHNFSVYDISSSTNRTIIAFVGGINTFCSQSHVLKNVEIIFCAKEDAEFVCNFVQASLTFPIITTNLTDCLYLIRCHLNEAKVEAPLKQLLQFTLDKFGKMDISLDDGNQPNHLMLLKTVRFLVRRFHELSLLEETNFIDDSTLNKIQKLLIQLDLCIRKLTTEQVLSSLLNGNADSPVTSFLTGEQMISLCNINQQMTLNKAHKTLLDRTNKLVRNKGKSALNEIRSSSGVDFNSDQMQSNSRAIKCLLNLVNRCPFCEKVLSKVTAEAHCPHHQLDICANSLLIIDPLHSDLDLCVGCLESKLLRPRIWPSLAMSPFDYSYDRCLFCL